MLSGPCELGLTSCCAVNTVSDPNIYITKSSVSFILYLVFNIMNSLFYILYTVFCFLYSAFCIRKSNMYNVFRFCDMYSVLKILYFLIGFLFIFSVMCFLCS